MSEPQLQPLDSSIVPRYADVATFMRVPRVDELDAVDVGLFGIPLDTASFLGGTRQGPAAVREASRAIRRLHPTTGVSPFDQASIGDLGDAPVNVLRYQESLIAVADWVAGLDRAGVAPVAVGGDHSATLPVLRGLRRHGPLAVLQIDSHADVQDEFFGTRDNHASVMRRAVEEELVIPSAVVQVGLRGSRFGADDVQYGADAGFTQLTMDDVDELGRAGLARRVAEVLGDHPVYVTVDIDGLDPTEAPGTAAREPGGLSMRDLQVLLRSLHGREVVGGDVCEVAPPLDPSGLTATNAANVLFEITCLVSESIARRSAA